MLKPYGKNKLYFIIVGTGRCGTVYFAKLLTSIGIPCSHECLFGPEGLNLKGKNSHVSKNYLGSQSFVMAEASYMAVPYLDYDILADATIIHAVRNPINVIKSFHNKLQYWHNGLSKWEQFILSHLPEINQYDNPLTKNCCYVVKWNQWIESQAKNKKYIRVCLESDSNQLLEMLGVPKGLRPSLGFINSYESWDGKKRPLDKPVDKKEILDSSFGNQVRLLAERYGYEV